MAKHTTLLLVAIVANLLTATAATLVKAPAPTANKPTAYEMLGRYGFPPGILPVGVHDYELRPNGSFEVHFSDECKFRVDGQYDVHYSTRVTGNIKNDTISGLEGIKVKVFIAWASIKEVGRDGDELRLHAGIISKSFPVGDFSSSPKCN
ncbi:unnamed protein product [Triticum turgidum subsp. durum]|uniref:Uncharacterized protein n=1 Tax=Triticum turgidum subsp. durum TaxID=4567 RepID=A0A9R1S9C1_TRITD|nr:unnamed protein product [Triticum turgidum subsp. durum]